MELKEGYKQTEVGVIPEDWAVICLGDYAIFLRNKAFSRAQLSKNGNIRYLHYGDIHKLNDSIISPNILPYISEKELKNFDFLYDGDIVFVDTSEDLDGVGKSVEICNTKGINLISGLHTIPVRFLNHVFANGFKRYLQYIPSFILHLKRLASGIKVFSTQKVHIAEALVAIPPIAEQKAIASALSDGDALLSSLEALIAKKRDIKTGAMQELLTGKTRLPGFSGEWVEKRISDIAELNPENLPSSTSLDYTFNYIALEDVSVGNLVHHSKQIFSTSPSRARRMLRKDDILVATVRPNLKSHFLVNFCDKNWICSTGFCVVRCNIKEAIPRYIYCHFFEKVINRQIDLLITGSNYPAISSLDVGRLVISLPADTAEQAAIAAVLSDMDAEIAALETRRAKVQAIKDGMMQELLTGRTRLLPEGERHG